VNSWYSEWSGPISVEGGLMARSARGAFAQTWWSERFVSLLEGMGMGGRLQRGRSYARRGQVISLDVAAGMVTALVQGSRPEPYDVEIGIDVIGEPQWAILEQSLADSAWYSARLLAGEMPEDIEEVFAAQGLSLFPVAAGNLSMDCSCPDWGMPCKHIAAAFYLLAETFDEDPFAILAWRGRDREDLLASLQARRGDGPAAGPDGPSARPLDESLESYFAIQADLPPMTPPATESAALLSQLPPIGLAIRGQPLTELLHPAYVAFGSAG
jgi:uncharacterized Zn finger protein